MSHSISAEEPRHRHSVGNRFGADLERDLMRQQEANLDKRANEQPEWQYRLEASYSVPVDCLQSRIVYDCNRTLDVQLATNQSLIQRR